MLQDLVTTIAAVSMVSLNSNMALPNIMPNNQVLASHEISLDKRYAVKSVSDVFKDNILLNLAYMDSEVKDSKDVNWNDIQKPHIYQFKLNPNETFAFHDDILPEYKQSLPNGKAKVVRTTNAHFNYTEGFKSDGYLTGDGVCHLASLMYWVAKDANLDAVAPTNHDFMPIPEISKQYGVAIYASPGSGAKQNLYITNNKSKPITFKFEYKDNNLKLVISEES